MKLWRTTWNPTDSHEIIKNIANDSPEQYTKRISDYLIYLGLDCDDYLIAGMSFVNFVNILDYFNFVTNNTRKIILLYFFKIKLVKFIIFFIFFIIFLILFIIISLRKARILC